MTLTDKLTYLLKERGISRKEFSRQSGIPYMTIVNFYEKGTENVKLSTLKKIAAFFDVSLDYIADDSITNEQETKKASGPVSPDREVRKQVAIQNLMDALLQAGIIDSTGKMSNRDFEFLKGIVLAIRAHFDKDSQ